jgi:hypothetical protein
MYVVYCRVVEGGARSWSHLYTQLPSYWLKGREKNECCWMVPGTVNPED